MGTPVGEGAPSPATAPAVVGRGIGHRFGDLDVLDDIDIDLVPGTVTAVVGPSGCGKSTLLRIIAGLTEPTTGEVSIDGRPPRALRDAGEIAVAFQDAALLPWRSVRSNVSLARSLAGQGRDDERVEDLIDLVGLAGFEDVKPAELSGGMRQRAAMARCLATAPRLLLLDEPFGAVDELTRRRLNIELPAVWQQASTSTALLVTHSITEAVLLADQVLVMSARPGSIDAVVPIDIERPRRGHHLHDEQFHRLVDDIENELGVAQDVAAR